jgi:hypothetical protein
MKKSEAIIKSTEPEQISFRFQQLRRDLFPDSYVATVLNSQSEEYQDFQRLVYINQHIGKEYSFPDIIVKEKNKLINLT